MDVNAPGGRPYLSKNESDIELESLIAHRLVVATSGSQFTSIGDALAALAGILDPHFTVRLRSNIRAAQVLGRHTYVAAIGADRFQAWATSS